MKPENKAGNEPEEEAYEDSGDGPEGGTCEADENYVGDE